MLTNLCQQCRFLFSSKGFEQLISTGQFRHSQLTTFEDRPYCCFCSYLWNDDLLGASSQVYKIRRLRDLLYSSSRNASSTESDALRRCWVVISRPATNQYCVGPYTTVTSLELYAVAPEQMKEKGVDRILVTVETDKGQLKWQGLSPLRLVAPKSSPLAKYTNYRHVGWDGLTNQWVLDIKAMLQLCLTSHPRCQQSRPRVLPTRLLHIKKDRETNLHLQLVNTIKGHTGDYAALSYCWGGPQPLQLTKSTVHNFLLQSLDRRALPKGLNDAVEVASSLDIEYLWVDALCIVQDDEDDKKREIGRMSAIYQNSLVTIAAATSSSVHESFLRSRSSFNTKYSACDAPFILDPEDSGGSDNPNTITIVPVHAHRSNSFPLNQRGWAFQESLLPPRLLVFGDLEPFVRCRTKNVIHKSFSCIEYGLSAGHSRRILDTPGSIQDYASGLITDGKRGNLDSLWREIVEQYTLRELSVLEDRPYAINGIVDLLSEVLRDECHFGVWRSCPVLCLLWKAEPVQRTTVVLPHLPTWSWMSITGPVDLEATVYLDKSEALVDWDADTSYTRLIVTCCVLEAEGVYGLVHDFGADVVTEAWPDILPSSSTSSQQLSFKAVGKCAFLVLGRATQGSYFAIIVTDEEPSVYRRCGLAELKLPESWRARPKRQIVLV
ncbi:HET-domain-containing protein [Xylaria sp. FL1777]|nr:HET-domain-containing protein [Xylaria sp. FL1777]